MINRVLLTVAQLRSDRKGVTAIEYALIATFIAVAIITGATTLGTNINSQLTYIGGQL